MTEAALNLETPVGDLQSQDAETARRTLLAAVIHMHVLLLDGAFSGAFQDEERGPTMAAGAILLAAFDDTDLLLRATEAFTRIHGYDPYSFATRLSSRLPGEIDRIAAAETSWA